MVTCGHQFHTGDESDWLICSSASCPIDGNTTATKILRKLIKKHCKKVNSESEELKIQTNKGMISLKKMNHETEESKKIRSDFSFYSQPDNNHYIISQFLQDHYRNYDSGSDNDSKDSFLQSKSIRLTASKERELKFKSHRESRTKYNKGISGFYDFANFDESQHLDGCPVKWLYRKKSIESLKSCKTSKCYGKTQHFETKMMGKCGNYRDRTPGEIKIRKMHLKKKESLDEPGYISNEEQRSTEKERKSSLGENKDIHKKKLAAKLNWKPFCGGEDDHNSDISSEKSARDGYLPPRPLLGLKPLLSVLLSPRQDSPCCSVTAQLAQNPKNDDRSQSASLSIKSLDLPSPTKSTSKARPRTIYAQRWGAKGSKFQKKLQTPSQITIKLRQIPRKTAKDPKDDANSNDGAPSAKKTTEKVKLKYSHSLTSLCYELGNKANCDTRKPDQFEQMIRELATEDKDFKIKRFLNSNNIVKIPERLPITKKIVEKKKVVPESENINVVSKAEVEQFQIICTKAQFFDRPGKPMK